MLRGFVTGSIALIILYVVVQPGASKRADEASGTLTAGLRRLLSPDVAGIGNHTTVAPSTSTPDGTGRSGQASLPNVPSGQFYNV